MYYVLQKHNNTKLTWLVYYWSTNSWRIFVSSSPSWLYQPLLDNSEVRTRRVQGWIHNLLMTTHQCSIMAHWIWVHPLESGPHPSKVGNITCLRILGRVLFNKVFSRRSGSWHLSIKAFDGSWLGQVGQVESVTQVRNPDPGRPVQLIKSFISPIFRLLYLEFSHQM